MSRGVYATELHAIVRVGNINSAADAADAADTDDDDDDDDNELAWMAGMDAQWRENIEIVGHDLDEPLLGVSSLDFEARLQRPITANYVFASVLPALWLRICALYTFSAQPPHETTLAVNALRKPGLTSRQHHEIYTWVEQMQALARAEVCRIADVTRTLTWVPPIFGVTAWDGASDDEQNWRATCPSHVLRAMMRLVNRVGGWPHPAFAPLEHFQRHVVCATLLMAWLRALSAAQHISRQSFGDVTEASILVALSDACLRMGCCVAWGALLPQNTDAWSLEREYASEHTLRAERIEACGGRGYTLPLRGATNVVRANVLDTERCASLCFFTLSPISPEPPACIVPFPPGVVNPFCL